MALIPAIQALYIPTMEVFSTPIDMVKNVIDGDWSKVYENVNDLNRQGGKLWKYWVEWVTG